MVSIGLATTPPGQTSRRRSESLPSNSTQPRDSQLPSLSDKTYQLIP
jgi:hypothetical protein